MGNIQGLTTKELANTIKFKTMNIETEFNRFIKDAENNYNISKNHITGGVSTGVSYSETVMYKNKKMKIWIDINYIKILRGRYKLINSWINNFNKNKPEVDKNAFLEKIEHLEFNNLEQKEAYLRRYMPIEEPLKIDDIKIISKIPSNVSFNKINIYLKDKFKTLFEKHGYDNSDYLFKSFCSLLLEKEGRCTSGLYTFLEIFKKSNLDIINNPNYNNDFHLELSISYIKPEHSKLVNDEKEKIKEIWKNKIDQELYFYMEENLKEGDKVNISSEYFDDFEWVIPKNFINNNEIGDKIFIKRSDIKDNILFEIEMKEMRLSYSDNRKLNEPDKVNKDYSNNYNSQDNLDDFIKNSLKDFNDVCCKYKFEEYHLY